MGALKLLIDYLGWAGTVVFVTSYFCKRAEVLRRVQMIAVVSHACAESGC